MASSSDASLVDVPTDDNVVVIESSVSPKVGEFIGQCKWWADQLGYGFLTIQNGPEKGKDIFVHHSGIRPLNSNYKTLKKGEYVNFDIVEGNHGNQAVNVTGIGGGSLICDVNPYKRSPLGDNVPSQPAMPSTRPMNVPPTTTGRDVNPNRYHQRVTNTSN
jgi:cold shock protein